MSRLVFPVDVELYWYDVLLAHNRFWHGKPAYESLGIQIKETYGKGVGGEKGTDKNVHGGKHFYPGQREMYLQFLHCHIKVMTIL